MAFNISLDNNLLKEEKYVSLLPQIDSLIKDEKNLIANLANITSALKYSFEKFLWVGFYFMDKENEDEIVLGPFQGRVACNRIQISKGVCGTALQRRETIIVDDVAQFPGHIVCDSLSKSEIVIPIIKDGVKGVLDIDSDELKNFDSTDKKYLEQLVKNILYLF